MVMEDITPLEIEMTSEEMREASDESLDQSDIDCDTSMLSVSCFRHYNIMSHIKIKR